MSKIRHSWGECGIRNWNDRVKLIRCLYANSSIHRSYFWLISFLTFATSTRFSVSFLHQFPAFLLSFIFTWSTCFSLTKRMPLLWSLFSLLLLLLQLQHTTATVEIKGKNHFWVMLFLILIKRSQWACCSVWSAAQHSVTGAAHGSGPAAAATAWSPQLTQGPKRFKHCPGSCQGSLGSGLEPPVSSLTGKNKVMLCSLQPAHCLFSFHASLADF